MDPKLLQLAAGALAGIAARPRVRQTPGAGGQVVLVQSSAAELGQEAAELARATLDALEEQATDPSPEAPATKPAKPTKVR